MNNQSYKGDIIGYIYYGYGEVSFCTESDLSHNTHRIADLQLFNFSPDSGVRIDKKRIIEEVIKKRRMFVENRENHKHLSEEEYKKMKSMEEEINTILHNNYLARTVKI